MERVVRQTHRTVAPLMGILIGMFCVTSLVYRIGRDFYGLDNTETHFFLDIHDGMIYGVVGVSLAYIVFSWMVIGVQVVTGLLMVECKGGGVLRRDFLEKDWSRRIHHTAAPLGALLFLYKMFTAGTYHLLTEGFRVSPPRVHFLLDMHDARIPGVPWFPTFWAFFVVFVAVVVMGSGLTILKTKPGLNSKKKDTFRARNV